MRIPFSALQSQAPAVGDKFRINLFRSQGPSPNRIEVVWQPTMSRSSQSSIFMPDFRLLSKLCFILDKRQQNDIKRNVPLVFGAVSVLQTAGVRLQDLPPSH
jgi:hypothetical protein